MSTGKKLALGLGVVVVVGLLAAPPYFNPFDQAVSLPDSRSRQDFLDVGLGPRNFEVTTFEGEKFRLRSHRGRVVVVNFWESW